MNWRILAGLVLLLVGVGELYTIIANKAGIKSGESPIYVELGCATWMAVGIFLIIKGSGKKEN